MKLSSVVNTQIGLVLSRKLYKDIDDKPYDYKSLNLKCINENGYINTDELDKYTANESIKSDYLTHKGDIVVRLSYPYTAVLITEDTEDIVVSSNFVIIRVKTEAVLPDYLVWYLNTDRIKLDIRKNVTGNVLAAIRPSYFSNMQFKLLPIQKQQLLARINSTALRELQLLDELKVQKARYYKQLMNDIQFNSRKAKL